MVKFAWSDWIAAAGAAATALISASVIAAVETAPQQTFAEALAAPPRMLAGVADVHLRFLQEDGPESGHVRVLLTPETRPLTLIEARSAAEQAFLAALKEPGLGDGLSQITVVVRVMPASHPDPLAREQVFRFLHKGGREWSVLGGD
jgi:hypothetical protein